MRKITKNMTVESWKDDFNWGPEGKERV